MKRAFLRAIGVNVPTREYVAIIAPVEISGEVYDCFKNRQHVNL